MTIYVANIMSSRVTANKVVLSEDAIKQFLETQKDPIPVTVEFDKIPIGYSRLFRADRLDKSSVLVEFELERSDLLESFSYVVPSGKILEDHYVEDLHIIDSFRIDELSFTNQPSDSSLKPVKETSK